MLFERLKKLQKLAPLTPYWRRKTTTPLWGEMSLSSCLFLFFFFFFNLIPSCFCQFSCEQLRETLWVSFRVDSLKNTSLPGLDIQIMLKTLLICDVVRPLLLLYYQVFMMHTHPALNKPLCNVSVWVKEMVDAEILGGSAVREAHLDTRKCLKPLI